MKKKTKKVLCHCCKKPATDCLGKQKRHPICWECIRNGGSFDRGCSIHHPEIYDEYAMPKKKKIRWLKKPTKPGWYWIKVKDALSPWGVGYLGDDTNEMTVGTNLICLRRLWNYEFHPVEPPK